MFTGKKLQATSRYYSPFHAPRMLNDSVKSYKSSLGGYSNEIIYVSGDVRDETSWQYLQGKKFSI
jgi:hypothetical protein